MDGKIDVQEIMEQIRAEIKEKGYKKSDLSFQDIPVSTDVNEIIRQEYSPQEFQNLLHQMNCSTNTHFYRPVGGGLKGFVKKVVRKFLAPIVLPVCEEQELFNSLMVQTMNQMQLYIELQEKRIDELEKMISGEEA